MPKVNNVLKEIGLKIEELAKLSLKNYKEESIKDGKAILNSMKDKIKKWTLLLINKDITTEEFEWLVNSQKGSLKMSALLQSGLNMIRIDQFKASVFNIIVDTVFDFIGI